MSCVVSLFRSNEAHVFSGCNEIRPSSIRAMFRFKESEESSISCR